MKLLLTQFLSKFEILGTSTEEGTKKVYLSLSRMLYIDDSRVSFTSFSPEEEKIILAVYLADDEMYCQVKTFNLIPVVLDSFISKSPDDVTLDYIVKWLRDVYLTRY